MIENRSSKRVISQKRRLAVTITLTADESEVLERLTAKLGRASTRSQVAAAAFRRGLLDLAQAKEG